MEYTVRCIANAQNMAEIDWTDIPRAELAHQKWLAPCDVAATAQVCHDDAAIYVRMEAREANIRCEGREALSPVWEDSCLEFFFAPMADDTRYLNMEWNPAAALCFGFGAERKTRMRQVPPDKEAVFVPDVFYTETGWGICFRVPLSIVRMYFPAFSFGGTSAGNFYKCGDKTQTPHYLAWSKLTGDTPDYHRRGDFGVLRFE